MQFNELRTAIESIRTTGTVGTFVAQRLLVQLPVESPWTPAEVCSGLWHWTQSLWRAEIQRCGALLDPTGRQWSVVLVLSGGQTVSWTVTRDPECTARCEFLLTGNTGIAQLQGADALDLCDFQQIPDEVSAWESRLAQGSPPSSAT